MNKSYFIFLLFISLSLSILAQHKDDGHPGIPAFNGPVKSLIERADTSGLRSAGVLDLYPYYDEYTFDIKGRCLSRVYYMHGSPAASIRFSYDDTLHSEEVTIYPTQYTEKIRSHTTWYYRNDGSLMRQESVSSDSFIYAFQYDNKGSVTEAYDSTWGRSRPMGAHLNTVKNSYDSLGQLSKQQWYANDSLFQIRTYRYDIMGNETEHREATSKGKLIARTLNTFDNQGHKIEQIYFAPNEIHHYKTEFNDHGDPKRIVNLKPSGAIRTQIKYKYKYDKYHNWIERRTNFKKESHKVVRDSVDGMLDQKPAVMTGRYLTKRTIQYY